MRRVGHFRAERVRLVRTGSVVEVAEPVAPGLSPTDSVVGPTLEVFLHEMAHAVFELFRLPVLGREEDAADQIAAYMLLNLVGAALACYSSYLVRFMPFVLLEGVWAIVAAAGLVRAVAARPKP